MLKLDTLKSLMNRLCPYCNIDLEFDDHYLHCPHCKKGWDYNEYKRSKALYKNDPEEYINYLIYEIYPQRNV